MNVAYTITPLLRIKLREPFGTLLEGTANQTMDKLKELVSSKAPVLIVAVGDVVSRNLHDFGVHPLVSVIDNVSMRNQPMQPPKQHGEATVEVCNPQGTITQEAIDAIKEALAQASHTHVVVEGEEDLLTLIAVLYAPLYAFVVYGQPNRGIVVVEVTSEKKAQVERFLKEMKASKS
jgi:hypothetical protein